MASTKYRFKRLDNVGALAAEDDDVFLSQAFVDVGYINQLQDCRISKSIVLGRTGAGKTALISELRKQEERVVDLKPESLALAYLSNSTILDYLTEVGVKLDIFFKLLWRHVFVVELIKKKAELTSERSQDLFFRIFRSRNKKHQAAIQYLEDWGSSFWKETDYRIREVTQTLEQNLKSALGSKFKYVEAGLSGQTSCTEEEKTEIINKAQKVVNEVQIGELSKVIEMLADILAENVQKKYYIVIDQLDENWIEDGLRYKIIRALIETVRDFRKVSQAKIIVAIRWDLLDRVFKNTRDSGFQEEKYEALYLSIDWSRADLLNVVEKRINTLIEQSYTDQKVKYSDILPNRVGKEKGAEYFIDRTLLRPRDAISFLNCCLEESENKATISQSALRSAEGIYSRKRLRALYDEWYADYPNLERFTCLLRTTKHQFLIESFTSEEIDEIVIKIMETEEGASSNDRLAAILNGYFDSKITGSAFLNECFSIFYKVGLVGLKLDSTESYCWTMKGSRKVSTGEVNLSTSVRIHPAFWRVLGVKPKC